MDESPHGAVDPSRWRRVRELFDDLVDLDPAERRRRLEASCGGDAALRHELESLLAHDRSGDSTITSIVAGAAIGIAGGDDLPPVVGHYRILRKLGAGGMGEVYLAEDTTLGRRVALKVPAAPLSADADARARLEREARAAATLNHPHVCVVHEVGTCPDGRPFIAMEHVEGETLAARLSKGPLPLAEVIRLGREAAGALADAHAHGIVHRDIKPSNIVLTSHGIKLLDFGLASIAHDARRAGEPAGFMGTIRYMSPEQARGDTLDERTDLFSLGVVLYEAATGRLPFDGVTPRAARAATLDAVAVAPSRLVGSLPGAFDRVAARALAKDRNARYQSASELADELAALAAPRRWSWRAAAVIAALLAGAGTFVWGPGAPPVPARPETVLVGAFANATGDPAFDGALREALVVQLQQTPFLTVFPEAGVRETLRLMARPPGEPLTPRIAAEIAVRRGIPAWIGGSIERHQAGYLIALTATTATNGEVVARERVEAATRAQVLSALGEAAVRLRKTLGESAPSLQQFSTPVEQATTASLDALKAYALGVEQANRGDYANAASLFERAARIDPDFALAHLARAQEEQNSAVSGQVEPAAARAFELRYRATEREQWRIVTFYHQSVTGDLDQALDAARSWQRTYPSEWRPYHVLADLALAIGAPEEALESAREAVRLNPDVAAAYSNLGGALFTLDRFDEARDTYQQAMARGFDAPEYHAFLWRIAYYSGDEEGMRQQLDWAASSSTWALNMPALAAALQGRWREARAAAARSSAFFESRGLPGLAQLAARYEALSAALVGDCPAAHAPAERALAGQRAEERAQALLALGLCGEGARAVAAAETLARQRPTDTRITRIWVPLIHAVDALERDEPRRAIEWLQVAAPYDGAAESWPIYLRGQALLAAGAWVEARAEFEKILGRRGRTYWPPLYPLAHLGRARAAGAGGDTPTAARSYEDLFTLWKDADPDLPVLEAARRERQALPR